MKKNVFSSREAPEIKSVDKTPMLHTITRFWVTVLIIVAILYIALLVISRTAGFRDLVRQRLEHVLGMPILVEQVRVSPALHLRVVGLRDEASSTNQRPVLVVGQADVRWRYLALLRGEGWPFQSLTIQDVTVRFSPTGQGGWTPLPAVAAALWPWMNPLPEREASAATTPNVTEWLRMARARVDCRNIKIVWMAGDGGEIPAAMVEGVSLKTTTVQPDQDTVLWSILRVQSAETGGRPWLRELELEWIRMPDQDIVLRIQGLDTPQGVY